jgi:surface antigen
MNKKLLLLLLLTSCEYQVAPTYDVGDEVDSFNGVEVYYNGSYGNVSGRNVVDGYNVGLRYQCVEFIKRYYLEHLNHKMPNSYGHAKSFFNGRVKDGSINSARNLRQFTNPSTVKPKVDDILVFDGHSFNKFGHIAIISSVREDEIEIIQQNTGSRSRSTYPLTREGDKWKINHSRALGWLRLKDQN